MLNGWEETDTDFDGAKTDEITPASGSVSIESSSTTLAWVIEWLALGSSAYLSPPDALGEHRGGYN